MGRVYFLNLGDVLRIHRNQIELYGGSEEVRDIGLLVSAIGMPGASFGGSYLHDGLPAMAAAYMYHVIQNHPFVDGNKRTGTVSALIFLNLNGSELEVGEDTLAEVAFMVAASRMTKQLLTEFISAHLVAFDDGDR